MKENASFFMVRHGGSNYECEGTDITKEGFKQMEKAADDLIKRLDRDNDLIILVSSPKARAKGSLAVINRKIGEAGFRIVDLPKEKNIRKRLAGMVTMDVYGKMHEIESDEFNAVMDELWGEHVSMDDIKSKFQKWATQGNLRFLASGGSTNTHEEMVNDVKNELDFANRSVSFHAKKKKENERVVVVAVTHGEVIDTFLGKNGPGASASDEDWREVDYGEIVEI